MGQTTVPNSSSSNSFPTMQATSSSDLDNNVDSKLAYEKAITEAYLQLKTDENPLYWDIFGDDECVKMNIPPHCVVTILLIENITTDKYLKLLQTKDPSNLRKVWDFETQDRVEMDGCHYFL